MKIDFDIIFPIVTLIIGVSLERTFDFVFKRRTITREAKEWIEDLRYLSQTCTEQITQIDEFLTEHNKDKFNTVSFSASIFLKGETFNFLNKNSLRRYLKRPSLKRSISDPIQQVNRIYSMIEVMSFIHHNLKEKYQVYLKRSSDYVSKYEESFNELMAATSQLSVEFVRANGEQKIDPLTYEFERLYGEYLGPKMKEGKYDLFEIQENFIMPLVYHITHHRLDERTEKLRSLTHCNLAIQGIRLEKGYLSENLGILKGQLEKNKGLLNEIIKEVDNPKKP